MIIYNVTIKVDASIADAWLQWMQQEHAPALVATGCFTHYQIVRLLEVDDADGPTYAVQYHAPSMDDYERYKKEFAAGLQQQGTQKWGDRFIAFRTLMEVVQ
ncbi:MAG: DUF4286 family protein [Chitinophagaceae bacterium]